MYLWGNPWPPITNSLTIYESTRKIFAAVLQVSGQQDLNLWQNIVFNVIALPFFFIWLSLEIFSAKKINRTFLERDIFLFIIIYCSIWSVLFSFVFDFRYFMPFYGYMIVRSAKLLEYAIRDDQASTAFPKVLLKKTHTLLITKSAPVILTLLIFTIGSQYFYVRHIFPDHVSPYLKAVDFLKKEEIVDNNRELIILVDTDHGLRWHGDFVLTRPNQPPVAVDFLKLQKNGDILNLVKKYKITHIINSPWESPWENSFYADVEKDRQHFIKIYEDGKMIIWRIA